MDNDWRVAGFYLSNARICDPRPECIEWRADTDPTGGSRQ